MQNVPESNGSPFWKGVLGGVVIFGGFVFPAHISTTFWIGLIIKVFSAITIPGISGIVTLMLTDWYNLKFKDRFDKLFKSQKNGKNKSTKDEDRAA